MVKLELSGIFLVTLLILVKKIYTDQDFTAQQLKIYKESHPLVNGSLTTSFGAPVNYQDADNSFGYKSLLNDEYFMDIITHLNRERIPQRIINVKGVGARGYFEVTHDVTDISKANFLNKVGKKTKVFVRFSKVFGESGTNDGGQGDHGFAIKFYTKEGNFDLVGINIPVYFIKDPLRFPSFLHSHRKNPVTNLYDSNAVWDFVTLNPAALFPFLYISTDLGFLLSYRFMPGYIIHTYQFVNNTGGYNYARLCLSPDLGIKNITAKEAAKRGSVDSDYLTRDLYNAIANGKFPSWTLYMQEVTSAQIKNAPFDVFDVTRVLAVDQYPLRPVGKLILNENPANYFADVEQVAFCPGNVVPGVLGAPDQMFQARRFAYKDAQPYRLGVNFRRMSINCPFASKVETYIKDGPAPVGKNGGSAPNYYPNSFHGPAPRPLKFYPKLIEIQQSKPYNLDQATNFIKGLTEKECDTVVTNIVHSLSRAYPFLQERAVKLMTSIDTEFGKKVKAALS